MGISIAIFIGFLFACGCGPAQSEFHLQSDSLSLEFYRFVVKYGRPYINNSSEMMSRFRNFKESILRAQQLNMPYKDENSSPVYGVNKFADMTPAEFKAKYLSCHEEVAVPLKFSSKSSLQSHRLNALNLPKFIDWRKKSVLSPIKDQAACGACWAYSTIETMESMSAIQYNSSAVPHLSVQELIDCDKGNKGCRGGDICYAAEWASSNGVVREKTYPSTHHTDACKKKSPSAGRVKIKHYSCNNLQRNETEILQMLAEHGPVTVAVDATTWHNYVGGIIRFHCSHKINHAVQIVGYNLNGGDVPYYIVRNSWGSNFGDHGYMYVKFGDNLCGIALRVVGMHVTPIE